MSIGKACELFGINNISDINCKELALVYKKLMRKYHPDNFGSDSKAKEINEAYEILKKEVHVSDVLKASETCREVIITDMGRVLSAYDKNDRDYISRLKSNQSYINIELDIYENGIWTRKESFVTFRFDCKYTIEVELNTAEQFKEELSINIYGKEYRGSIGGKYKSVVIRISNDIELTLRVTRNIMDTNMGQ